MDNVPQATKTVKLTLTSGPAGAAYRAERLPRKPGDYRKGFRLTGPNGETVFAHELPCGLHECSCPRWVQAGGLACEHTELLTAAGLFDDPVRRDELYRPDPFRPDELVDIDWESEAP